MTPDHPTPDATSDASSDADRPGADRPGADRLRTALADVAREVAPDLPLPGRGRTPERFAALADLGRRDLAVARLAEAHTDAVAILADAGHDARPRDRETTPVPVATYGVWAARTHHDVLHAVREGERWHVTGRKPWCTGVGIVTHALVTAETDDGPVLVRLRVDDPGIRVADRPWVAEAFADTGTVTLEVEVTVDDGDRIGDVGSYLSRPGFWHGASGVAACWAGGLDGVRERAARWWRSDPHASAHRAAIDADAWALTELVAAAGRAADAAPDDGVAARRTALRLRHLVDAAVERSLTRIRRGCGPAPFAFDGDLGAHVAQLELYVRQCHAERDLEALAGLLGAEG